MVAFALEELPLLYQIRLYQCLHKIQLAWALLRCFQPIDFRFGRLDGLVQGDLDAWQTFDRRLLSVIDIRFTTAQAWRGVGRSFAVELLQFTQRHNPWNVAQYPLYFAGSRDSVDETCEKQGRSCSFHLIIARTCWELLVPQLLPVPV